MFFTKKNLVLIMTSFYFAPIAFAENYSSKEKSKNLLEQFVDNTVKSLTQKNIGEIIVCIKLRSQIGHANLISDYEFAMQTISGSL